MAQQVPTRRGKGTKAIRRVRLDEIEANRAQPRQEFDEESIEELARSIRRYGLLSPPVVREAEFGYELIAGERRIRALKKLGAEETDVIVMNADDRESALIALIENLQREDLSFFEEAEAYRALIEEHGMSRDEVAARVGRSVSSVANRLRLLKLGDGVRKIIKEGGLTERHARALLAVEDTARRWELMRRVAAGRLTVAATERLIAAVAAPKPVVRTPPIRDVRVFSNTVKHAVETMCRSGVQASVAKTETSDYIEFVVRVAK